MLFEGGENLKFDLKLFMAAVINYPKMGDLKFILSLLWRLEA